MMTRRTSAFILLLLLVFPTTPATADIDVTPDPRTPEVVVDGDSNEPGSPAEPISDPNQPGNPPPSPIDIHCEEDVNGELQCVPRTPQDDPADALPLPTEADVLHATRTIGLPSLTVKVQPDDKTLVNIPTVLYAEPQPFERTVTILGYRVDLVAVPTRYRWIHGDGTHQTTSSPGKRYPAMDVTHRYKRPAKNVTPSVDVTYQVRYRIDGGAWQTIGQTLTASGPAVELDVAEAAPVLTKR